MSSTIKLEIVTPSEIVYSEEIDFLKAPAIDGEIGILPKHAPLVTGLKTGLLRLKKGGEDIKVSISEGFIEVKPTNINIVVRTAELPYKIDIERAKRAKERAEERLNKRSDRQVDYARAEAALKRALARLKAVDHI